MRRGVLIFLHVGAAWSAALFVAVILFSETDRSTYTEAFRNDRVPVNGMNVRMPPTPQDYGGHWYVDVDLPTDRYGTWYMLVGGARVDSSLAMLGASVLPVCWLGYVLRVWVWRGVIWRWQLERWRRRAHLCRRCGYDVRATADAEGVLLKECPECGALVGDRRAGYWGLVARLKRQEWGESSGKSF